MGTFRNLSLLGFIESPESVCANKWTEIALKVHQRMNWKNACCNFTYLRSYFLCAVLYDYVIIYTVLFTFKRKLKFELTKYIISIHRWRKNSLIFVLFIKLSLTLFCVSHFSNLLILTLVYIDDTRVMPFKNPQTATSQAVARLFSAHDD